MLAKHFSISASLVRIQASVASAQSSNFHEFLEINLNAFSWYLESSLITVYLVADEKTSDTDH